MEQKIIVRRSLCTGVAKDGEKTYSRKKSDNDNIMFDDILGALDYMRDCYNENVEFEISFLPKIKRLRDSISFTYYQYFYCYDASVEPRLYSENVLCNNFKTKSEFIEWLYKPRELKEIKEG